MPDPDRFPFPAFSPGLAALVVGTLAATAPASGQPAGLAGPAVAPRPAAPSQVPRPKAPDPVFEAAQTAFGALPEEARREIQDALAWTGHSTSVVTGAFGRRTFEAILSYQKAAKAEPTGILDAGPRAALIAAGRRVRDGVGFVLRRDGATGIAIGIPARLLPREGRAPQGTRWQSQDGRITLETRAFEPAESDLQATFDRVSVATPDRKITYRLKRPDFLVVTGETPTGRFYIRYATTPSGLRGFTLAYDKTLAAEIDPVVIAIANSFDPAPPVAVPAAGVPALPRQAGPSASSSPPAPAEATPARTATGLAVASGRLLTTAQGVAGCASLRVGRLPARIVAADEAAGLALLAFQEAGSIPPPTIAADLREGDVIALGADRTGAVTATPGTTMAGGRVVAPLQPGVAGAPLLDRGGRLAGVVAGDPAAPRLVAGLVPTLSHAVVPPALVSTFLARQGIAVAAAADAPARTTGEVVNGYAGRVRQVTCE